MSDKKLRVEQDKGKLRLHVGRDSYQIDIADGLRRQELAEEIYDVADEVSPFDDIKMRPLEVLSAARDLVTTLGQLGYSNPSRHEALLAVRGWVSSKRRMARAALQHEAEIADALMRELDARREETGNDD
jgi:hypothetical protein